MTTGWVDLSPAIQGGWIMVHHFHSGLQSHVCTITYLFISINNTYYKEQQGPIHAIGT